MAAGLGFKTFTTGEVLTAADTNGYLMQGVLVFASAAARDAAITSPQEGQFAYLKDTNVTTYYTGSAWANLDTTGMTNPMTTTGDTIYSSSGSTPARLGIGSTGQVLTVAGGIPSWATAAGGGAWSSYTPTLTGWTLGNGTLVGFYNNDGKTVNVAASVKWGSTTSASGNLYLSLPVAADLTLGGAFLFNIYQAGGSGVATDNSADTYYAIASYVTGTTTMRIIATNGANNSGVAVSIPFTWATNDMMIIEITYKAA